MKYMLLIYATESCWTEDERKECMIESMGISEELKNQGKWIAASPSQSLQVLLEEQNAKAKQKGRKNAKQTLKCRKQPGKKSKRVEMPAPPSIRLSEIHCKQRLGGLLKSYSRAA